MQKQALIPADEAPIIQLPHCELKWICHDDINPTKELATGFATFQAGNGHDKHYHPNAEEVIYVVRGQSQQELKDQIFEMKAGDSIHIPKGAIHWTKNVGKGELEILVIFSSPTPETVGL